jgi:hypothetical protein
MRHNDTSVQLVIPGLEEYFPIQAHNNKLRGRLFLLEFEISEYPVIIYLHPPSRIAA